MKKIVVLSIAYLLTNIGFAQIDDAENNVKNFRFGLKGNLSVDWLTPENEKKFKSNGSGIGYGWGAQLEYRLNKTASIVSGFGIQTAKGKIGFFDSSISANDTTIYILNKDEEFVTFNRDLLDSTGYSAYQLINRKYSINYVTIPIALKMKTKEIGYFTYYGQFGLNLGIKTKVRVDDEVIPFKSEAPVGNQLENTKLDLTKGIQPIRSALIVGGGAEYTISGTTAVFFDLTYNYFFTNALKKNDEYLGVKDVLEPTGYKEIKQKAIPGSVALTVGILF